MIFGDWFITYEMVMVLSAFAAPPFEKKTTKIVVV